MRRDKVAIASLAVSILLALGSWEQIWKGVTTFAETPLARWALIAVAVFVLVAASVASVVGLSAFGRNLKRRIDSRRRLWEELQATAILHHEIIGVLTAVFEDDGELHVAVVNARKKIAERGIILDDLSSVGSLLEGLDPQVNIDNVEEWQVALRELETAARKVGALTRGGEGRRAGR